MATLQEVRRLRLLCEKYELEGREILNRFSDEKLAEVFNGIGPEVSIIRKCFLSKLRFDIACNYIPAHSRAKAHNIPIDSQLVELPEI